MKPRVVSVYRLADGEFVGMTIRDRAEGRPIACPPDHGWIEGEYDPATYRVVDGEAVEK